MRIRTVLSQLFLGATLMYGGTALAQQAANPYIRSTEIAAPSEAVDPNVVITADGPVSVTNRRTMTPEEFGVLFGAEPTGAAAKAVLTAGADPVLTEGELTEILEGVKGTGQTLKPIYHIGSLRLEVCTPGKKGKCVPCAPGQTYTMATSANGKGDDDLVTFTCPDQKAARAGAPSCSSLYSNHGVCLDDALAGAFGLTEKKVTGSCTGKNTACYDATKAKKFATTADLDLAIGMIKQLADEVDQVNGKADALVVKTDDMDKELKDRLYTHSQQINVLRADLNLNAGINWEWGLGVGYFNNGANGGELFAFVGAPVVGDNGHLDLLVRGYLAKNHDSNTYSVVLPTAVQQTTDVTDVRRYMDVVARFQWDMLGGYLNPLVEVGAGWQKASQGRTIDLLGDVRNMSRDEHQFLGTLGAGATGRIYGPLSWYGRANVTTKAKAEGSVGLQLDF